MHYAVAPLIYRDAGGFDLSYITGRIFLRSVYCAYLIIAFIGHYIVVYYFAHRACHKATTFKTNRNNKRRQALRGVAGVGWGRE